MRVRVRADRRPASLSRAPTAHEAWCTHSNLSPNLGEGARARASRSPPRLPLPRPYCAAGVVREL
jgi:hypothetical protein